MFENIKADPQKLKRIKIAAIVVTAIAGAIVTGIVIYKFGMFGNKFVEEFEVMGPPGISEIEKLL